MAAVIIKTREALARGFKCQVCGHDVPGTKLAVATCPNCRQKYAAEAVA